MSNSIYLVLFRAIPHGFLLRKCDNHYCSFSKWLNKYANNKQTIYCQMPSSSHEFNNIIIIHVCHFNKNISHMYTSLLFQHIGGFSTYTVDHQICLSIYSGFRHIGWLPTTKVGLRPPRGICEAHLNKAYRPCAIGAIPSQTYGNVHVWWQSPSVDTGRWVRLIHHTLTHYFWPYNGFEVILSPCINYTSLASSCEPLVVHWHIWCSRSGTLGGNGLT